MADGDLRRPGPGRPDPVDEATRVQRQAADPRLSVALRASAGSGKTKVLIDRFVRLCIEDPHPVHPRSILAITFTRKAATEIQDRLLRRARELAAMDDAELAAALANLFDRAAAPAETDRAARLYERLLENPGSLQVGTLHAFCQRILVRFAAEAGLDPHARLIEDQEELLDEVGDRMVARAADDAALAPLAALVSPSPEGLKKALRKFFHQQMRVERWLRRVARQAGRPAEPRLDLLPALLADVRTWLFPGETLPDTLTADEFLPDLDTALRALAGRGLADVEAELDDDERKRQAKSLAALIQAVEKARQAVASAVPGDGAPAWEAARDAVVTKAGAVRKFSKLRDEELKQRFQDLVLEQIEPLLVVLRRADLADLYARNRAELTLGLMALDLYAELKRRDGVIDFGDLEDMACLLMDDQARALSLLLRLDDSITHVLLDEFQDTNWNQYEILQHFIAEFLSRGDDGPRPTVFAVGDLKQSIYGFRGAEPSIFAHVDKLMDGPGRLSANLPTNFRSQSAVVDGVGRLFQAEPLASTLDASEIPHVHQAVARKDGPGVFLAPAAFEDAEDERTGQQVAADAAARLIRELVDAGTLVVKDVGGREELAPLAWGDVLVLLRSRSDAGIYESALRRAGIPIEPAGRGMLAAAREVQDVLALLRWLAWPEDDVALCTVLRSSLLRLSEAAFQNLLDRRDLLRRHDDGRWRTPPGVWRALRDGAAGDARLQEAAGLLDGWRRAAGFADVHELLRRIFREGHVRERCELALGPQARHNLERLFDLALGLDVARTPTIRRFVEVLDRAARRGGEDEALAPLDEGGGRVRLMTIHGAKGLEAPVVLLVDADRKLADREGVVRMLHDSSDTGLVFGATKGLRAGIAGAEDVMPADLLQDGCARARRLADIEEGNLLYVALTRARDRLYVLGGAAGAAEDEARTPLARLRLAAAAAPEAPVSLDDPDGWERPPAAPPAVAPAAAAAAAPPVVTWQPPALSPHWELESPSSLEAPPVQKGAASASPADPHRDAAGHGDLVHHLLQWACDAGAVPPGQGAAHDEAAAVFGDPALAWIFRPGEGRGVSEAPFLVRRGAPGADGCEVRLTGFIDRVIVRDDSIDIIDYKTNRGVGDDARRAELCRHYAPQLAAYAEAAAGIWPGREVRTWLLFTEPGLDPGLRLQAVGGEERH